MREGAMAHPGDTSDGKRSACHLADQHRALSERRADPTGATHSHCDSNESEWSMIQFFDYPFHFDGRGRVAQTDSNDHIRDLIEQVIFTSPGERVNRPTFGSGVLQLVFAPNSVELAA